MAFAGQMLSMSNGIHPQTQPIQGQNQPRVSFFITRSNDTMVPLIPADELPFNVVLHGVPRVLTEDQARGMRYVGSAPYTGLTFQMRSEVGIQHSVNKPQTPTPTHEKVGTGKSSVGSDVRDRQVSVHPRGTASPPATVQQPPPKRPVPGHELKSEWRKYQMPHPTNKTQAVIDAIVCSEAGAETAARIGYQPKAQVPKAHVPFGNSSNRDKKEYCTYWVRTGECDYIQQGCLYKHEMPDRATLQKIGFRTVPRWWTEKNQMVNMGRNKAIARPAVKPCTWLKSKPTDHGSDKDGESSESDVGEAKSVPKSSETAKVKQAPNNAAVPSRTRTLPEQTPSPAKAFKTVPEGDLIDFAPLVPIVLSPVAPPPLTSSTEPIGNGTPPPASTRVFVPGGESPEDHITEAHKRSVRSLEAQESPVQHDPEAVPQIKQTKGLMASKHAPPEYSEAGSSKQPVAMPVEGNLKVAKCRPRRPAVKVTANTPNSAGEDEEVA